MARNILIVGFVLALTFGVFVRTTNHNFIIWDDDKNIYENPFISQYHLEGIVRFWEGQFAGLYIPVTYTAWSLIAYNTGTRVNYGAGPDPIIDASRFHLANVLLHTGSVALLILLFYRLLGRRDLFAAAMGASLFALHPLQVEPVAWATGLKDVLSGFLALICVLLYLSYSGFLRRGKPAHAWCFYAAALVLYILALLSKPQLVVIPPIIAILLWSREKEALIPVASPGKSGKANRPLFGDILWLTPFLIAAFIFVIITMRAQPGGQDAIFSFERLPVYQRPVIALDALGFYLTKLFYPFQLTVDYGRNPIRAIELAFRHFLWILPLAAGFLLLFIKRHRRLYLAAFAVALVAIAPVLGLIPFAFQGQSTVADRYCYLPMIGLGFAAAIYLTFTRSTLQRYLAVGILCFMAVVSFNQVAVWKNTETLYEYALTVNPKSVASTYNLGLMYSKEKRYEDALEQYHRAIELKDDFSFPWNNIGFTLNTLNRFTEAIPYLEKAIEINPNFEGSYTNLGIAQSHLGEYEKAIAHFDKALEVKPDSVSAIVNMGVAYMGKNEWEKAITCLKQATRMNPNLYQPHSGLGDIYLKIQDYPAAIESFANLVNLQPGNPRYWRSFAYAYAYNGQFDQAAKHMKTALDKIRSIPAAGEEVKRLYEREYENFRNGRMESPGKQPGSSGSTESK